MYEKNKQICRKKQPHLWEKLSKFMTKFKGKKRENLQGRNCSFMGKQRQFSMEKSSLRKRKGKFIDKSYS